MFSLHRRLFHFPFLHPRENGKAISHRWNVFFPRSSLFLFKDSILVTWIPRLWKKKKILWKIFAGSFNLHYSSNFPGVHAVTYRDAVRSWEYLQLVGPSVRWVRWNVEKKRAINTFDVSSEKWSSSRFDDWIPRVQVSKEYTFHLFNTRFDGFYAEKFRICKYYSHKHWFLDVTQQIYIFSETFIFCYF